MSQTPEKDPTWSERSCKPCEGGVPPMGEAEIQQHLDSEDLQGWEYRNGALVRTYRFKNYYRTLAFVNAVGWIAHQEDHHPELVVSYKTCEVRYRTHAIGGISENDFICAAKVDRLLQ
jgi:4a-hydroxytetrahydrobiopterin dehydratase